jgi:hypothetical protein
MLYHLALIHFLKRLQSGSLQFFLPIALGFFRKALTLDLQRSQQSLSFLLGADGFLRQPSLLCLLRLAAPFALQRCLAGLSLFLGPTRRFFRLSLPFQYQGRFPGLFFFISLALNLLLQQKSGLTGLCVLLSLPLLAQRFLRQALALEFDRHLARFSFLLGLPCCFPGEALFLGPARSLRSETLAFELHGRFARLSFLLGSLCRFPGQTFRLGLSCGLLGQTLALRFFG